MLYHFRLTPINVPEIITQSASNSKQYTHIEWCNFAAGQSISSYTQHRPVYLIAMKKVYNYLIHFSFTFICCLVFYSINFWNLNRLD